MQHRGSNYRSGIKIFQTNYNKSAFVEETRSIVVVNISEKLDQAIYSPRSADSMEQKNDDGGIRIPRGIGYAIALTGYRSHSFGFEECIGLFE